MWLLGFTAKCQNLSIEQQYEQGIRLFDFRIRFDKNNSIVIAHGIIEYQISLTELTQIFRFLDRKAAKGETIYIRIFHEIRNKKAHSRYKVHLFSTYCRYFEDTYTYIKFFGGYNLLPNWSRDYIFRNSDPSIEEYYASVRSPKFIDDWWPWFYAIRNNKRIRNLKTEKEFVMIDFIEL